MRRKLGFTLAEVLITLGIIGVVAAMTIPGLIHSYKKMVWVGKLKQNFSLISQGFRHYIADSGNSLEFASWRSSEEELTNFFRTYFKEIQNCDGTYAPCFAEKYGKLDNSRIVNMRNNHCQYTGRLVNGAAICADAMETANRELDDGDVSVNMFHNEAIVAIEIDINGPQGPNVFGLDYFVMAINDQGNIFDLNYEQEGGFFPRAGGDSRTGALGKIIKDGWKMTYSYPIKESEKEIKE